MKKRTLIVCPGRGSYDRSSLGGMLKNRSDRASGVIDLCDEARRATGRPTVREMDGSESYSSRLHVAGENASILTACASWADFAELDLERHDVVGVIGNSMGWYTALGVAGALPMEDAVRLVDTMGAYQEGNVIGGQILFPVTDEAWRPDAGLLAAVDAAIEQARERGGQAFLSIRLGSYAVVAGDEAGCALLMELLPKVDRGTRTFPTRLPLHSAFHTPLMAETSMRARQDLADLRFGPPQVPLIDGRGVIFRPRWASAGEMWEYTLGAQVTDPYDFSLSVRTALRHTGAELVATLGPGNSLGGPLAALLVAEGWNGVRSRADLDARQAADPLLLSFGVTKQREFLV